MKQLILLVLISAALNPISICAQETDTHDEADSSASHATDHSLITADKPGVSKVAWDILTSMTEFISGTQDYTTVVNMGNEVVLCDNLALRSEKQDIQLWIAKGSNPAPCRIVVTYKKVEGQPQF